MDQRTRIIGAGATLLGGGLLALLVDSAVLLYALIACAVIVTVVAYQTQGAMLYGVAGWIMWTWGAFVFGLRSLQIIALWPSVLVGCIVVAGAALLWERMCEEHRTTTLVHLVLTGEALLVLFFATTSFFILGALLAVWFVGIGLLLHDGARGGSWGRTKKIVAVCGLFFAALILLGTWYL